MEIINPYPNILDKKTSDFNNLMKFKSDIYLSFCLDKGDKCNFKDQSSIEISQYFLDHKIMNIEDLNFNDVMKTLKPIPINCKIKRKISREIIRKQNRGILSILDMKWNCDYTPQGEFIFSFDKRQISKENMSMFKLILKKYKKVIQERLSMYYKFNFIIDQDGNLKVLKLLDNDNNPYFSKANHIYKDILDILLSDSVNVEFSKWLKSMVESYNENQSINISYKQDNLDSSEEFYVSDDEEILLSNLKSMSNK